MTSDEEWIEDFCLEVKWVIESMVLFNQKIADAIEVLLLEDPIKHEKKIRQILNSFGGGVTLPSPRGTNRGDDTEAYGRMASWSCENDKCLRNHCSQCGHCGAKAGDGHTPFHTLGMPACKPKPTSRKDRQDE